MTIHKWLNIYIVFYICSVKFSLELEEFLGVFNAWQHVSSTIFPWLYWALVFPCSSVLPPQTSQDMTMILRLFQSLWQVALNFPDHSNMSKCTSINALCMCSSSAAGGPFMHSFYLQRHNICSMMRSSRKTPCHKPCLSWSSFCFLNSSVQLHLISVCFHIWRCIQQTVYYKQNKSNWP